MSIAGCARVEGDEEEDGIDDLDNEFDFDGRIKQDMHVTMPLEVMLHTACSGSCYDILICHLIYITRT